MSIQRTLMRYWVTEFRLLCICLLLCCSITVRVSGQLTANKADGSTATFYTNPKNSFDTIFVFNQVNNPKKGDLSLQYIPASTIEWTYRAPDESNYKPYKTFENVKQCHIDTLATGSYTITITNPAQPVKTINCQVGAVLNELGDYTVTVTSGGNTDEYINQKPHGRFNAIVDTPESTYKWYRFDYASTSFDTTPFATVSGKITSTDTLSQGGYKVTVETGAVHDSFVSWLYMNPGFEFRLLKNDEGAVRYLDKNCQFTNFVLEADKPVVQSSFIYYNPKDARKGTLTNKISFTMQKEGVTSSVALNKQGNVQYFRDSSPPRKDTRFYFVGKDMFDIERKDDILYETILPEAKMTLYPPKIDPESAPVMMGFTSESLNSVEYFWRFGDGDSIRYDLENLQPDTVKHTYFIPKNAYKAVLFVTSLQRCTDSTSFDIIVAPSKLEVPNVFTPNGDAINDYWKPANESIRSFEISIYARSGQRVYHFEGGDLRTWEGWDGSINGGKDAAQGVYFFTIQAIGWDDKKYNKKSSGTYGGSFHLYR